jgi:cytochrome oxidase assembly protein ShyY1
VKFRSIRFRLAAWYFVGSALILTLFALGAWMAMRASVRKAVDHDLRQRILEDSVSGMSIRLVGHGCPYPLPDNGGYRRVS